MNRSTRGAPAGRARAGGARRRRRLAPRLLLFAGCLSVVAVAVTAWLTLPRWYSTWMPAEVGKTAFPLEHTDALRAAAERHRLDPALVAAVIYVESGFDPAVESRSGAVGLMQVMPATADEIAQRTDGYRFTRADLRTPRLNVLYGCYYLRLLLLHYDGSLVCALAAYNAGAGNVDEWRADNGGNLSPAVIPFVETREYVYRVLRTRTIYRHVYGPQLAAAAVPATAGL
jgi:soluble lytic murein transglycosylase